MSCNREWIFIDDSLDEAEAFAAQLNTTGDISVKVLLPAQAREKLLSGDIAPSGVLVDVDLSSVPGEMGTGPGVAQDIRVKQRAKNIAEFPLVRFAALAPVQQNVSGDPSSDDLFDLKIQKEELRQGSEKIVSRLIGLREIYDALESLDLATHSNLSPILNYPEDKSRIWSHEGFESRVLSSLQTAAHIAAGVLIRSFINPTGLLLDENLLAIRLGISAEGSGESWKNLISTLPFKFTGIGADYFPRWWSRGLEEWWFETVDSSSPLVSLTIEERITALEKNLGCTGLSALEMPEGSPGSRPWRICSLSLEGNDARVVPIDPSYAVRLMPAVDLPSWVDPLQASPKYALQNKGDLRLNRADISKFLRKGQA